MATSKKREYREDANGVDRLVAAPGDDTPAKSAEVPGPATVEMAPQVWDDKAGEFKPGPEDDA